MKVCAVQLHPKHRKNYSAFYLFLKNIFEQAKGQDLIVFPENINFCLLFYTPEVFVLSTKSFIEYLFDKIISKINLSYLLKKQDIKLQKEVILSCFMILAKKYKINVITGSFYEQKDEIIVKKMINNLKIIF